MLAKIITTAALATAGAGAIILTAPLSPRPDAPDATALVATATSPAPDAPEPGPFDEVDAMLNPFREIDAITKPAPPALPPPPLPVEDMRAALYRNEEVDTPLVESIIAAFLDRARHAQADLADITQPIPLIPPALPRITIVEEATRLARILRAAGHRHVPRYTNGSPAAVRFRQLTADPATTEEDLIRFYASLAAS
jgi:hypothetical protein